MKTDFHISHAHKVVGMHGNLPFWISMIQASQKVIAPDTPKTVLDFGSREGKFLPVFALMDDLAEGVGVEIDSDHLHAAQEAYQNEHIRYRHYDDLSQYESHFDVAYSQETLYTLPDLAQHANEIMRALKPGGYYFATMGSHLENPLWPHRRRVIRAEEDYPVYDYSLEEVADVFFAAGFEVGLKRLPVEYFLIYNPEVTKSFSRSYSDLVETSYRNKMFFLFYKDEK